MSQQKIPRLVIAVALASALIAALILGVIAASIRPEGPKPSPSAAAPVDVTGFERPDDWSAYRPSAHLTPQTRWMNDPQRPVFADGLWHLYYLYNADHPDGNGTAWYHVTSTDLVHWSDEGVAIEKYRNGLGDIWTGSVVVDEYNTAGLGAGALVALVTQQDEGVQRQSLFYSTDGGYEFESYEGNPVMDNPGVEAWRDPKIVWDDQGGQWLMLLAEGTKVGFYVSPDLKGWTYVSGFERDDLGVLECPDLFRMSVEGDPSRTRWVLGVSANGEQHGRTTGYAYWAGEWDGERFTPDHEDPLWLDEGSDFYAGVTWDDPADGQSLERRYAIGWMNNWSYAGKLPTKDWSGGVMSTVRELRMRETDGQFVLRSRPIEALDDIEGETQAVAGIRLSAGTRSTRVPQPADRTAFRLRLTISPDATEPADEVRVRMGSEGAFATVGVDFTGDHPTVFIARDADEVASRMPGDYREIRTTRTATSEGRVVLDIVVDASSIEVFGPEQQSALSDLVFLGEGSPEITLESIGGHATLDEMSVSPLAVAEPDRQR